MLTKPQLDKIVNSANEFKNSWNSTFWTVGAYTIPSRNYIWRQKGLPEELKQIPLFTTAGRQGSQIFIARIQNRLTPFEKPWVNLSPKDNVNDAYKQELRDFLASLSDDVNGYKEKIKLDKVLNESYYDLILGTAVLLKQNTITGLKYVNIPLIDVKLGLEENQSVVRDFKMCPVTAYATYPELRKNPGMIGKHIVTKENEMEELPFQDIMCYNEKTQRYEYYLRQDGEIILSRVYKKPAYKIMHWDKPADMPYGDGVGLKALPALQRLNAYIKANLELLPFAFPMFIAQNNALFDKNITFKPGGIIRTNGDPNQVIPVQLSQQANRFQLEIQREEMEIKQIMLDYTLPSDPKDMTAAEVYARTNPQDEMINASMMKLTDVIKEIVTDIVEFIYRTKAQEYGLTIPYEQFIEMVDIQIGNGSDIDTQTINKIAQYIGFVGQFDPQAIYQSLRRSQMLVTLQKAMGLPQDITATKEEIEEAQAQAAEAEGQAAQAQIEAEMAIDNNKENAIAQRELIKQQGV